MYNKVSKQSIKFLLSQNILDTSGEASLQYIRYIVAITRYEYFLAGYQTRWFVLNQPEKSAAHHVGGERAAKICPHSLLE